MTAKSTHSKQHPILTLKSAKRLILGRGALGKRLESNQHLDAFFAEGWTLVIRQRDGLWEGGWLSPEKTVKVASYGNGLQVVANAVARCVVKRPKAKRRDKSGRK